MKKILTILILIISFSGVAKAQDLQKYFEPYFEWAAKRDIGSGEWQRTGYVVQGYIICFMGQTNNVQNIYFIRPSLDISNDTLIGTGKIYQHAASQKELFQATASEVKIKIARNGVMVFHQNIAGKNFLGRGPYTFTPQVAGKRLISTNSDGRFGQVTMDFIKTEQKY